MHIAQLCIAKEKNSSQVLLDTPKYKQSVNAFLPTGCPWPLQMRLIFWSKPISINCASRRKEHIFKERTFFIFKDRLNSCRFSSDKNDLLYLFQEIWYQFYSTGTKKKILQCTRIQIRFQFQRLDMFIYVIYIFIRILSYMFIRRLLH